MPDEVLTDLENAGFQVEIEGESLMVSLQNRKVRRHEVAQVLNCDTADLDQKGSRVRVNFAEG